MYSITKLIIVVAITLFSSSCSLFVADFKEPSVSVLSFSALPPEGINPRFEIGMRVSNPNSFDLKLQGLSYTAYVEGQQMATGEADTIPVIAAMGEGDITVTTTAHVLGGLSLMADLLQGKTDADGKGLSYRLLITLDIGQFGPPIVIEQKGDIAAALRR